MMSSVGSTADLHDDEEGGAADEDVAAGSFEEADRVERQPAVARTTRSAMKMSLSAFIG
jgi:hypothetical protein